MLTCEKRAYHPVKRACSADLDVADAHVWHQPPGLINNATIYLQGLRTMAVPMVTKHEDNDGMRERACEWRSFVEKAALPLHEELVLPARQGQV